MIRQLTKGSTGQGQSLLALEHCLVMGVMLSLSSPNRAVKYKVQAEVLLTESPSIFVSKLR